MESFLWVAVVSGNGTTVVFLECLQTLSNVYEKVKIFEMIQSRKSTENVDDPFGLKKVLSCINIPHKFLT